VQPAIVAARGDAGRATVPTAADAARTAPSTAPASGARVAGVITIAVVLTAIAIGVQSWARSLSAAPPAASVHAAPR
jgi:hypothetical protein